MSKPELPWHSRFDLLGITFYFFSLDQSVPCPPLKDLVGTSIISVIFPVLPPSFSLDWSILDRTLWGLLDTLQIALVSTLLAIILSFIISLELRVMLRDLDTLAHPHAPQPYPYHSSLLWALLAVVIVGSNSLAVIALLLQCWIPCQIF